LGGEGGFRTFYSSPNLRGREFIALKPCSSCCHTTVHPERVAQNLPHILITKSKTQANYGTNAQVDKILFTNSTDENKGEDQRTSFGDGGTFWLCKDGGSIEFNVTLRRRRSGLRRAKNRRGSIFGYPAVLIGVCVKIKEESYLRGPQRVLVVGEPVVVQMTGFKKGA